MEVLDHVMLDQRAVETMVLSVTKMSAQAASLCHVLMAQMSSAMDV